MAAGGSRCRKRERHAAIQQGNGSLPRHRKFTHDPAVRFRPVPFAMRRRAVVADGLGDFKVLSGLLPNPAQRRQRRWGASLVVLPHEWNVAQDAPGKELVLDPPRQLAMKGIVGLLGFSQSGGAVVAQTREENALVSEPFLFIRLQQRRELFKPNQ